MLSLMTISVGMDEMLNCWARLVSASVSTLPNTASEYFSDARSKTGANMRHGPHQEAQKSTRTMSAPPTTDSKFWPVSSTVAMEYLLVSTGIRCRIPSGVCKPDRPRPHSPAPPPCVPGGSSEFRLRVMPGAPGQLAAVRPDSRPDNRPDQPGQPLSAARE